VNILPLIFTFLIIFSSIAFTFLKEVKSFYLAETTLNSFNRTERKVNNAIVQKAYRKAKGEAINKKENNSEQTKPKVYFSKRSFFPPFDNSKFNIAPLIKHEGDFKLHPLFEPLAEMVRLLYGNNLFERKPRLEKVEYRLLDALIMQARKHPESEDLAEVFPDDPVLRNIYYKMLKGTNRYSQTEGIPPLGDFVTIQNDANAISFYFASPLLLEALFGKEIALNVMQEEFEKWESSGKYHFYSKEDLQALLMKNPVLASKYSTLEPFFDFAKQFKPRTEMGGTDPKTGLSVKKNIF
jgi:hypothetical protein